jgi:ABC-type phosphate transport system permease subunit
MALPTTVYLFLTNIPNGSGMAYGAALVLLLTVLAFYSLAFFIRKQSQKKFKTVFKY